MVIQVIFNIKSAVSNNIIIPFTLFLMQLIRLITKEYPTFPIFLLFGKVLKGMTREKGHEAQCFF
jgi:hypothetical protein